VAKPLVQGGVLATAVIGLRPIAGHGSLRYDERAQTPSATTAPLGWLPDRRGGSGSGANLPPAAYCLGTQRATGDNKG
jgi:hypothetical protein